MALIDIGSAAEDRAFDGTFGYTRVDKANPANETGTITSIEIWAGTSLENCEVATFFVVSGNFLSTRDTHTIGAVTGGSKQTFSGLSLDVQAGDYIGIYFTAGTLDQGEAGVGLWYIQSDEIPCVNTEFSWYGEGEISLYGTGATVGVAANAIMFGFAF